MRRKYLIIVVNMVNRDNYNLNLIYSSLFSQVRAPEHFFLYMGSEDFSDGRHVVRRVSTVEVFPYYDRTTFDNDLALLKLEKKVTFTERLMPICLPKPGNDNFIGKLFYFSNTFLCTLRVLEILEQKDIRFYRF